MDDQQQPQQPQQPKSYDDSKREVAEQLALSWEDVKAIAEADQLMQHYHALNSYQQVVFMRELKIDQIRLVNEELQNACKRQTEQALQMAQQQKAVTQQDLQNLLVDSDKESGLKLVADAMDKVGGMIQTFSGAMNAQGSNMERITKTVTTMNEYKQRTLAMHHAHFIELFAVAATLTTLKNNLAAFNVNRARCQIANKGVKLAEERVPFDEKAPGFDILMLLTLENMAQTPEKREEMIVKTQTMTNNLRGIQSDPNVRRMIGLLEEYERELRHRKDMISMISWLAERRFFEMKNTDTRIQKALQQIINKREQQQKEQKEQREQLLIWEEMMSLNYDEMDQENIDSLIERLRSLKNEKTQPSKDTSKKRRCPHDKKGQCIDHLWHDNCALGWHSNGIGGSKRGQPNPLRRKRNRREANLNAYEHIKPGWNAQNRNPQYMQPQYSAPAPVDQYVQPAHNRYNRNNQ